MSSPLTADERERRFVSYISKLNRGQLGEVRLTRINALANFRKQLMELLNEMIETRAEELATVLLMQDAPPRQQLPPRARPVAVRRGSRKPVWVLQEGRVLRSE